HDGDDVPAPTAMGAVLARVGLDVHALPSLEDVDARQLGTIMTTFTQSLGLDCSDCHAATGYMIDTPGKGIARQMWEQGARRLRFGDGDPVYCDSCHRGRSTFLDRSDSSEHGRLAMWMQASYVTQLARSDGAPLGCATCHGTPFTPRF